MTDDELENIYALAYAKAGFNVPADNHIAALKAVSAASLEESSKAVDDLNLMIPVPVEVSCEYAAAFVDGYEMAIDRAESTIKTLIQTK